MWLFSRETFIIINTDLEEFIRFNGQAFPNGFDFFNRFFSYHRNTEDSSSR